MIHIDIKIKKPNRLKKYLYKFHSKLEDMLFSIIKRIPEKMIPRFLMSWLERYLTKRINQVKQEAIRSNYEYMHLQKAVDNISNRQQPQK